MRSHTFQVAFNPAWMKTGLCAARPEGPGTDPCRLPQDHEVHKGSHLHPVGTIGIENCPFEPCGRAVSIRDTKPQGTIEQHNLPGWSIRTSYDGPCPASLMPFPLTANAQQILIDQARDLEEMEARDDLRTADPSNVVELRPKPVSTNLRQPGRMGREPENDSPAWGLGGREDEDVVPQGEVVKGKIPTTTQGVSLGGHGMIGTNAGITRQALNKTDDAISKLADAKSIFHAIQDDISELGETETTKSWMAMLRNIDKLLEDAQHAALASKEHGEAFLNKLMY